MNTEKHQHRLHSSQHFRHFSKHLKRVSSKPYDGGIPLMSEWSRRAYGQTRAKTFLDSYTELIDTSYKVGPYDPYCKTLIFSFDRSRETFQSVSHLQKYSLALKNIETYCQKNKYTKEMTNNVMSEFFQILSDDMDQTGVYGINDDGTTYKRREFDYVPQSCGRETEVKGLQHMEKYIRNAIVDSFGLDAFDLDQVSAHPTYAEKDLLDLSVLREEEGRIEEAETLRKGVEVIQHAKELKKQGNIEIKDKMNRTLYLSHRYVNLNNGMWRDLHNAMKLLADHLDDGTHQTMKRGKMVPDNGRILSYRFCDIENKVQRLIEKTMKNEYDLLSHQFDGAIFFGKPPNSEYLDSVCETVKKETGYSVELKIKKTWSKK